MRLLHTVVDKEEREKVDLIIKNWLERGRESADSLTLIGFE
jgi:hypothetical protein